MMFIKKRVWRVSVFFAVLTVLVCPHVQATVGSEPEETSEEATLESQLVVIAANKTYQVFEGEELTKLMSDEETSPTRTPASMTEITPGKAVQIIYIRDNATLDSLDAADISALSDLAEQGVFLGIPGDGTHLREVLDITDSNDQAYVTNPGTGIYFTYGVPDGTRDDCRISTEPDSTTGELLNLLFDWIEDVLEAHQAMPAQDKSAWNATYSHDWRGQLLDGSTYRFSLAVYKLDTSSTQEDWYLVVTSYQSAILSDSYECTARTNWCGPFTYAMDLQADISTSNGGSLYGYMPTGTVTNTTESFTIGGSLSGLKPGVSASFTRTYTAPDVVIKDQSNYLHNYAKWVVTLRGPSYTTYPFISSPCNAAKHSYQIDPSFIVQVPKNVSAQFTLHPKIGQENDRLHNYLVYTHVKRTKYYWNHDPMTIKVGP